MPSFIDPLLFLCISGILFFVPGFLVLHSFFKKSSSLFSPFETMLFSFSINIGILDFLLLLLGTAHITFTPVSIALSLFFSGVLLYFLARILKRFIPHDTSIVSETHPRFSQRQSVLWILLLALTIFIKTFYLSDAVLPTATDLGHHMYWSKLIAETGTLPSYAKQEIITQNNGTYSLSDPQPIADFIIGEHLPFATLAIFSKTGFFSAFPIVFLFFVNLLSVLALAFLAFRLASGIPVPSFLSKDIFTPETIALATFFFFGPLYSLASPQAKFVSGGVVGNTLGNLFLPLILLISVRAFREKRPGFLALAFFLIFTLAYTHHLSTLILLITLIGAASTYFIIHFDNPGKTLHSWKTLFFSPAPLLVALFAIMFFFFVAQPTYIEQSAVNTAIGTPTKTTRTGLSFSQIADTNGAARVALGLAGILFFLSVRAVRRQYATAFLLGWSILLLIMTFKPHWLFIDIPSNRIGTYLSFPLGILSAFSFTALFSAFSHRATSFSPRALMLFAVFSIFIFFTGNGSFDNGQTLLQKSKAQDALQTFHATRYLSEQNRPEDVILKDHNYLTADSWMKLFFMRDYSYPLSRGFFKRYEDNPNREQCTLAMISTPNLPKGEKCYTETGTNIVMVNPRFDTAQFEKSDTFSKIYSSDTVSIYKRK